MERIDINPGTLLYPVPVVLVSCADTVSYTHLDVYKRQPVIFKPFVNYRLERIQFRAKSLLRSRFGYRLVKIFHVYVLAHSPPVNLQ